jgi:hypothetical protein
VPSPSAHSRGSRHTPPDERTHEDHSRHDWNRRRRTVRVSCSSAPGSSCGSPRGAGGMPHPAATITPAALPRRLGHPGDLPPGEGRAVR